MKEKKDHWAYLELEKKLAAQNRPRPPRKRGEPVPLEEVGTIFLFDPRARAEIDSTIREHLWPAVLEGTRGSHIGIYQESSVLKKTYDKRYPQATRVLIFLLEDEERPVAGANRPLWYVRGTLFCGLMDYMFTFDLILELPKTFDIHRLIKLISDDRLRAIPPTLAADDETYTVTFSRGRGGHYWAPDATPENLITEGVRKHLEIIEAVGQLEADPNNKLLFNRLSNAIISMYGDA